MHPRLENYILFVNVQKGNAELFINNKIIQNPHASVIIEIE